MDPLSATASIITVIQLSSDIVKYIIGTTGATKDRRKIRDEILACENILLQLQDSADDEEGSKWSEEIKALEGLNTPLYRLRTLFEQVKKKLEHKRGLNKALSALKWPFDEKEVERLIDAIQREKLLLQLVLTNDCRYVLSLST
jgi:flagellar motility protein MotE (MotC chaperone)